MLREIRCHNPKCTNTFTAEHGWRRLCDACRVAAHNKAVQKQTDRVWKNPVRRETKNQYWRKYRKDNLEAMRAYNREWMRRKRAGLPTSSNNPRLPAQNPALEACGAFKRCFMCAYLMDKATRKGP